MALCQQTLNVSHRRASGPEIPEGYKKLVHCILTCTQATGKAGNGKMGLEWETGICTKGCMGKDDSELSVILFNRTRDD